MAKAIFEVMGNFLNWLLWVGWFVLGYIVGFSSC